MIMRMIRRAFASQYTLMKLKQENVTITRYPDRYLKVKILCTFTSTTVLEYYQKLPLLKALFDSCSIQFFRRKAGVIGNASDLSAKLINH